MTRHLPTVMAVTLGANCRDRLTEWPARRLIFELWQPAVVLPRPPDPRVEPVVRVAAVDRRDHAPTPTTLCQVDPRALLGFIP